MNKIAGFLAFGLEQSLEIPSLVAVQILAEEIYVLIQTEKVEKGFCAFSEWSLSWLIIFQVQHLHSN